MIKQIIIGVSISVLSALIVSRLNLSKKIEIIVETYNASTLGLSRPCEDCRVIVTIENKTASFYYYHNFKLKLDQSKDDVEYQIQFIGKYCGEFYSNTYTGRIPANDSHYYIKFIETKKDIPPFYPKTITGERTISDIFNEINERSSHTEKYSNLYQVQRIYLKQK